MKKGFMKWLHGYIQDFPGLTAEQYAEDGYGYEYVESDAKGRDKEKVFSLASTLMKQVRDGKEPHIRRERIGKKYHYFPIMGVATKTSSENISFRISLSNKEWQTIDDLVSNGQFRNRSEVIEWIAKRCISVGVGLSLSEQIRK